MKKRRRLTFMSRYGITLAAVNYITCVVLQHIICVNSTAQITFQKTYGGNSGDVAYSIIQTGDSGFVSTGHTVSFGSGSQDVYLLKTDKWGELEWSKTYGGANQDIGQSVQQASDGGFIIGGYTNSFGAGFYDAYLIKTDSIGNLEWSNTYGGASTDRGYSVVQVSDGGFILAGGTYSNGSGNNDVFLIKTDSDGTFVWSKTYGGPNYDEAYSVCTTSDSGVIIIGTTTSFGAGSEDIYVLKLDINGNIQWSNVYGGSAWDRGLSISQTNDGGFILCGFTQSFQMQKHYDLKCYVLKLDSIGIPEWSGAFGILQSENVAFKVIQTFDGGYCIAGYSGLFVGDYFTYLVKIDGGGNLLWSKTIGTGYLNSAYDVIQTNDSGLVIAGYTNGFGSGNTDIHLIKTTTEGNSGCNSIDAGTLIKDTIPYFKNTNDSVTIVFASDSAATIMIDTNFIETSICDNKCTAAPSFTASDSIVCLGDTLYLYSTSTGADSVEWQVNDSTFSDTSNTFINLNSTGTYTIVLIAADNLCSDTVSKIIIVADTVIAGFDFSISNLTISFLDSSNFANSYYWNFGDGNTSTVSDPVHTYADTGIYHVCLIVTNNCDTNTLCKDVMITCKYPVSNFDYVGSGLVVSFFDSSGFSNTFYWIFDDGQTSTLKNPVHTYANPGTYDVCLVTINDCGTDAFCMLITVDSLYVGFQNLELENTIKIYPNPFSHIATLSIVLKGNSRIVFILYDIFGREVSRMVIPAGTEFLIIERNNLPDGMYFYKVESDTEILKSGKLMLTN